MPRSAQSGFTLIELATVVVVLGIVAAFLVPGAITMSQGMQLDAAANGVAGQLRLARSKAMATGVNQMMHFSADSLGTDYHMDSGGAMTTGWKFPAGITYTNPAFQSISMNSSGRASTSTFIILQNRRGEIDTVSVEASGLVTVY